MKKLTVIAAVLAMGVSAVFADAKGTEIMTKVHDVKKPTYSRAQAVMQLVNKKGEIDENRGFIEYGKNQHKAYNGKDITSIVLDFKAPASYAGTRFLQIEGGPNEQKFIRLATDPQPRRVNSSEGSKSVLGTDATDDDLETREVEDDNHTYVKDEEKNGYKCSVVESVPVDPKSSQYSKRIIWVDLDTYYPIYTELYDKNGKLLKVLTIDKIINVKGYNIPTLNEYKNVQTGHSTKMIIQKILVDDDAKVNDNVFTQNFLKNAK